MLRNPRAFACEPVNTPELPLRGFRTGTMVIQGGKEHGFVLGGESILP